MSSRIVFLLIIAAVVYGPNPAVADPHREETTPTGWWWHTNVTEAQIADIIEENDARLVDIEVLSVDPLRFTAAFVHNSGVYAEGWWWYANVRAAALEQLIEENDARLIDIEWYPTDAGPRLAAIMVDNTGPDSKGWWWYVNANDESLPDFLLDNEARLVDIETYQDNGLKFAAIMVDNTGADATGWWWYYDVPSSVIADNITTNQSRLLEFEVHDPVANTYDAILIPNEAPDHINWWWYFDLTPEQLNAALSQNGARITDIDTYLDGIQRKYSAVMVNNSNALTTKMGALLDYGVDGATGVYLKEVGGPVLASLQPTFVHEPSSSLKVTHHLYAVRQVMFGADDLNNHFTVAQGISGHSCPNDGPPFNDQSLSETLGGMMWNSNNTFTRAIELRYGRSAINDMSASVVGMSNTSINRRMGCNEGPLNETTLEDMTRLYEGVAQGLYLDPFHRDVFRLLMLSENSNPRRWFGNDLENLIHEVATDLGIPGTATEYWEGTRLGWKPGGDDMNLGQIKYYRSIFGWVSLPWECVGPGSLNKEFVFGLFIYAADDKIYADDRFFNHTIELFREQVAAGLIACVSAVDDQAGTPSAPVLLYAYPNPFNPQTTIVFDLPEQTAVSLRVYDVSGRLVDVILDEKTVPSGRNEVVWRGRDARGRVLPAGVYFYRLKVDEFIETRRMALVK